MIIPWLSHDYPMIADDTLVIVGDIRFFGG